MTIFENSIVRGDDRVGWVSNFVVGKNQCIVVRCVVILDRALDELSPIIILIGDRFYFWVFTRISG